MLVAYHRGRMCPEHGVSGGLMAAVGLGADEAEARLAKHGKASCVVGCDNSPVSTTLSGARMHSCATQPSTVAMPEDACPGCSCIRRPTHAGSCM